VADYVKHFNAGRPVVLIGQSQGAIVLRRLISREIDRKPKVRALLISALLMGSAPRASWSGSRARTSRRRG
jgi:alpha-beta hydrolase superfamily lysophospholipase